MSNTLFPIKSQPIDWKPPTLSENALQRYLADNLKRVTVKNPYDKTAVLESLFNESAGINSRLASFNEKKPAPKTFTCEYTRTFSASTRRSYISSVFFHKTEGCVLQGCNFIKKLVHHRLFSRNIFLRQLVFGTYSKKYL